MRSLLLTVALTLGLAAAADAQSTYRPTTALGGLGQLGVLRSQNPANGYRTAARTGVGPAARNGAGLKPFATATPGGGPTISPYLNLFRAEEEDAVPSYFTFVRPQQDQFEANRRQQQQLQQLQRQVQQASYSSPTTGVAGGARYGDTGRYYGGWRR